MRQILRFTLLLFIIGNFHAANAQNIDTIFGCDEIPATPLAGAACTICNFDILYGSTFPFTPSPDAGWCGTIENDQYIGFVAGPTGSVVFEMTTFNCINGQGVQVGIYDGGNSLVGDCFNQVTPGVPQVFTAGGLTPGEVYYMRIDGFAGDGCEFNIRVISGLISSGPDAPGPIMGQDRVCWDNTYPYFLDPVNNATGYYWQVEFGPWTAATTVDPPEALNPLTGTTSPVIELELPEINIAMPPGTCDTIRLKVFPLNPCFSSDDSSTFELRVCRPTQDTTYGEICPGGEYEFPPGSGDFYNTPFVFETVQLPPGPDGCDTFGVLFLEQIVGSFSDTIYPVVLCPGEVFDRCGFPDPTIVTGPTSCQENIPAANGCDSITFYYVQYLDPEAYIEAAQGAISCTSDADTLYAVTRTGSTPASSAGDSVTYSWTNAAGTVIGTDESVIVNDVGVYTLEVIMFTHLDPSITCTDTIEFEVLDARVAPSPPSVSGLLSVCADNVPQVYTATGATGTDQYLWTITPPTGATTSINNDELTVSSFGTLTSLTICAQTFNACDTSVAACETITVLPLPTQFTLSGPDTLCEGASGVFSIGGYDPTLTYTVTSQPTGASASVSGSDVNFTMGTASGDLCLEVSNTCGTLPQVCIPVEFRPDPVAIAPTGPTSLCLGDEEDYVAYTSLPPATTASVTVTGGTIVSQTGGSVRVEWTTAGTGQVCVEYQNPCGTDQACLDVDVRTAGTAILSGGGEYCEGNNDVEITITFTGNGPFDYTYELDGSAVSATSSSSPVVITSPAEGTYVLTDFSVNGCPGSISGSATVTENPAPTATLTGGEDLCVGDDATLEVAFTGVGPWTFELALDGTGQGTVTTGDNPYTTTVSAAGTYTLLSVVSDAGCDGTFTGSAVVTQIPPLAAGPVTFSCSADGLTYTATFTISGGDQATYQVIPAGAGTISGTVFTTVDINSGDPFVALISDANACDTITVSDVNTCPCLTMIGDLTVDPVDICDDGTATDFSSLYDATNEFLDPTDVREYILHTGTGSTITGAIAANSTGVFGFDASLMTYGTTYYISVAVGDDDGTGSVDLAGNCTIVAAGIPVTWYEIPTATLVGGGDVCQGDDSSVVVNFTGTGDFTIEYTIDGVSYTETVPGPSHTIDLLNLQATTVVNLVGVTTANCPGPVSGSATVTVHQGIMVSATPTVEYNATVTQYRVTFTISGGDPSSYTVDGTSIAGQTTWTSAWIDCGTPYSFLFDDQWNCDPQVRTDNPNCDCVTVIGSITADFVSCDPTEVATFIYDPAGENRDGDDGLMFILHTGDIATGLQQNTTGSFSFDPSTMTLGTTYFVTAVLGNFDGTVVDLTDDCTVLSNQLTAVWGDPPTATISGDYTVCPGSATPLMFDITGPGNISVVYTDGTTQWTEIFVAGSSSVAAPLTTDATYTIVSVMSSACPGTFSGTATVSFLDAPTVGIPQVEINNTGTQFRVTLTISGGDATTYTVDGTSLAGATTWASPWINCGETYSFIVDDAGGCDPVTVTGTPDCNCLTAIGTLTGSFESCDLGAVASYNYDSNGEFLDGDDAIEFLLYSTDVASPIARGASPNFGFDPSTMSTGIVYNVVGVAGNSTNGTNVDLSDPCVQFTQMLTAVWYSEPTATLSGPTAICANDDLPLEFTVAGSSAPMTVIYTVNGTVDSITNVVSGTPASINLSITGNTTIVLTGVRNDDCAATLNQQLDVTVASEIFITNLSEDCNATGTQYTVTFSISGGDPSTYVVSPAGSGTITGSSPAIFTSNPINSGDSYTFSVTDASACFAPDVSSAPRCDCDTDAGALTDLNQISVCAGDDIVLTFDNATGFLDPDDVRLFALRTDNDGLDYTDDLIELNDSPFFSSAALIPGETYYVTPIAGNASGTTIDNGDPCLDIGVSTPIFIQPLPDGSLEGTTVICEGGSADITLVLVGNGPFDVTIGAGDSGQDSVLTGIDSGFVYQVDPVTGTIYVLTNITDSSTPQCASQPSSNVTIDVNEILTAGVAEDELELCEGTGDVIQLVDRLNGEDPSGTWTQTSGPDAGANFSAVGATLANNSLEPGMYMFTYSIGSGAPCPNDQESIVVDIEPTPDADAGPDQALSCDEPEVSLGADPISGYTYQWSGGSLSDPTASSPSTTVAGTFTLTVTSGDAECVGTDEVIVDAASDLPVFENLLVRDVTCFGDTDGAIFTEVSGGTGPYSFTLDGETPRNNGQFTGVTPGVHELQVVDAEGCVFLDSVVIEEAKEVLVEAGPNVEIGFGESHRVLLDLNGDVETVRWSGDSLECISQGPLCDEVILWPSTSGVYQVAVRDSNGCTAEDFIQLIVRRDRPVYIPNAFSPNGDGINDLIFVHAGEGVLEEVTHFRIFDRWGEVMFAQAQFDPNIERFGWDGRFKGEVLNPGVFAYWCQVKYTDGTSEIFRGDITLMSNP